VFQIRVFSLSLRPSAVGNFGGVFYSSCFVLIPLVLILLLLRAQLDFSGDLVLQDTREARPHASAIGTVLEVQVLRGEPHELA